MRIGTDSGDLTVAMQDYLRAIYALESSGARVTTSALAERMSVKPPSATAMAKRLAELGLVERLPYKGVALTETGRRSALELLRHHRLLERYLADRLGYSIDEVHAEADRLEHALSEELEAKIDAELGFPTHDPHGGPIPDRRLRVQHGRDKSLAELGVGERASISQVPDEDAALLRYLTELGLVPGAVVEIVAVAPFAGPITVRSERGEHPISHELAESIEAPAVATSRRR